LANFSGDEAKRVTWLLKQNVLELPHWVFLALTFLAGGMMVSNVRYRSSKNLDPLKRLPFVALIIAVVLIVLIAAEPHLTIFAIFMGYFLSGPIEMFLFYRSRRQGLKSASDDLYDEDEPPAAPPGGAA
jgi:CDP-diacylglycerol--serine O-phosphatidyltransferase